MRRLLCFFVLLALGLGYVVANARQDRREVADRSAQSAVRLSRIWSVRSLDALKLWITRQRAESTETVR